jgi:hypothetical protein
MHSGMHKQRGSWKSGINQRQLRLRIRDDGKGIDPRFSRLAREQDTTDYPTSRNAPNWCAASLPCGATLAPVPRD